MSKDMKQIIITVMADILISLLITPIAWVAIHYALDPSGGGIWRMEPILAWDQLWLLLVAIRLTLRGL